MYTINQYKRERNYEAEERNKTSEERKYELRERNNCVRALIKRYLE